VNQRSRGFTLLELLVVLAIVALAAALVVPNIPSVIGATRLTTAAQVTGAFLREARALAIVEGVAVDFEIDPRSGAYRFADRAKSINPGVALVLTTMLPAGRAPGSPGVVRFYPDGGASGAVIRLERGGTLRVVAVDPLTGRVRVDR